MPEKMNAVRPAADKATAEHDIGATIKNRCKKRVIFTRIIFEISILDNHNVAGCVLNGGAECRAFALIRGVVDDLDIGKFAFDLIAQNVAGSICGAVINHHDFFFDLDIADTPQQLHKGITLVVDRNQHGERVVFGRRTEARKSLCRRIVGDVLRHRLQRLRYLICRLGLHFHPTPLSLLVLIPANKFLCLGGVSPMNTVE